MRVSKLFATFASASALLLSACGGFGTDQADDADAPFANMPALEVEEIGITETLAGQYTDNWVFAQDMNFNTLGRGKVMVIDAGGTVKNFRGQVDADQFASFVQSSKRNTLYVAETFYSRGSRGTRTDVVTIYDRDTLKTVGEIILPNSNRGMSVVQKNSFRLTNDQKFALLFTFTPSSGVAVIDLDSRKIVNEIDIPGCSLIYPRGDRGFASLCGDGTMVAYDLDGAGKVIANFETKAFNDIDNDPMFMKAAVIGNISYFPTFDGNLQAVTFGAGAPKIGTKWRFAGDSGWGPSGWQVITADVNGLVYVLMREAVKEGDHKIGGSQIWVLDPVKKEMIRKIDLKNGGFSIEATKSKSPLLMVTNEAMSIDVYDLSSDKHVREIGGFLSSQPYVLDAAELAQ